MTNRHIAMILKEAPGIFDTPGVTYKARYVPEDRDYYGTTLVHVVPAHVQVSVDNSKGRVHYRAIVNVPPEEAEELLDLLDQKNGENK